MSRDKGTTLIVWRHGITEWNAADRIQGQADTPLSELGREQAAAAAARLGKLNPDTIVSSDLSRAADTAGALAALTGLPVTFDERLRERYFGAWQGMSLADIEEQFPEEWARWRAGHEDPGCGIEPIADLAARVGDALRDVVAEHPGGTIVVACHGGAARHGVAALLDMPTEVAMRLRGLGNCHWAQLQHGRRGWALWSYNVNC